MSLETGVGRRSTSPTSSGRSSPVARTGRRTIDEGMYVNSRILTQRASLRRSGIYKTDKGLRRYAATIERALASWEVSPQEWADYISFLGRLLKVRSCHVLETQWCCNANGSRQFNLTPRMRRFYLKVVRLHRSLPNV